MKEIVKNEKIQSWSIPQEDFNEDMIIKGLVSALSTKIFPNEQGLEDWRYFAIASDGEDLRSGWEDYIVTLADGVDVILGEDVVNEDVELRCILSYDIIDDEYADEYAVLVDGERVIYDYLKPSIKSTPIEIDGKPFIKIEATFLEYSFKK